MALNAQALSQGAPGAGGAPNGQPQQRSFRKNTRSRLKNVTSVPVSLNNTQTVFLPQIGLLSMIYVIVAATFQDTGGTAGGNPGLFGPWNLLKRIRVNTNLGAATLVDVSGYGAFVNAQSLDRRLLWNTALSGVTRDPFYQYTTGTVTQNRVYPLSFCLPIPIAVNRGPNFALGLINLQAPQIQVSVDLVFGALSDITDSADAITVGGSVFIAYQYWEIPPPMRNVALPANVLVRTLEQRLPYANTGELTYVVPRMGRLLTCYHTVSANGALVPGGGTQYFPNVTAAVAPVAGVDYMRLLLNQTDEVARKDYMVERVENRLQYSDTELPAGTHGWNLFQAMGEPRRGDFRDALDTQAISEIDSIIAVNSGVTLGSGNNYIDTVRTVVQPFQVAATQ